MSSRGTPGGRLASWAPWAAAFAAAALWPFVLTGEGGHHTGAQLVIVVLIGLSLTVTVGWLRVISLFQPAAVAAGAAVTAALVGAGRSLILALAVAAAAGAGTGLAALAPAAADPRRWLPATSLVVTAAGVLVVPRFVIRYLSPPVLLGVGVAGERALYLLGLVMVTAAGVLLARLPRTDLGRRLVAVGAAPALAARSGVAAASTWRNGLALSGALAGAAGCLTALLHQGLPSPLDFAPTTAVAYLAIPLVGGAWSIAGALAGAVAFLTAARLSLGLGFASVTLPAALAVAAAAWSRPGGLVAWARRAGANRSGASRRRGPAR